MRQFGRSVILGDDSTQGGDYRAAFPSSGGEVENLFENGTGLEVAQIMINATIKHENTESHREYSIMEYDQETGKVSFEKPDAGQRLKTFFLDQVCQYQD